MKDNFYLDMLYLILVKWLRFYVIKFVIFNYVLTIKLKKYIGINLQTQPIIK